MIPGLQPLPQRYRCCLGRMHLQQLWQTSCPLQHRCCLCAISHHHQAIETKLSSPTAHFEVKALALITQLEHGAQHSKVATSLLLKQIETRQHRLRGGVVGLIEHSDSFKITAELQPP